jgi:hypothetical protein
VRCEKDKRKWSFGCGGWLKGDAERTLTVSAEDHSHRLHQYHVTVVTSDKVHAYRVRLPARHTHTARREPRRSSWIYTTAAPVPGTRRRRWALGGKPPTSEGSMHAERSPSTDPKPKSDAREFIVNSARSDAGLNVQ